MNVLKGDFQLSKRWVFQTTVLVLGVNAASIYYNFSQDTDWTYLVNILSKVCLTFSVYLFLQTVFRKSSITYLLLIAAYFLSFTVDFFNVIILKQYISFDNINSIYFTNNTEAFGFLTPLMSYLWLPVVLTFILVINVILLPKQSNEGRNLSKSIAATFVLLFLSFLFLFLEVQGKASEFDSKKNNESLLYKSWDRFLKTPPVNIAYRCWQLFVSINRVNKLKAERDNFRFEIIKEGETPKSVVFVISEGIRSNSWSINGYPYETSPNLHNFDNVVSFRNHFANGNNTYKSIPLLITLATPENPLRAYKEKSILTLFKEAGYKTIWITNQDIFYLGNRNEADSTIITFYSKDHNDLVVLKHFEPLLSKYSQDKLFVMINLVGNHGDVPSPFNRQFTPNTSEEKIPVVSSANKEKIINNYNNKIFLQDFVLGKIITSINSKSESSIVMYTADHGLNIFDSDNSNVFGYGADVPTKFDLNIPLIVWTSEKFKTENSTKFSNMQQNSNLVSDNDCLMYTLPSLCNLKFKNFDETKDLSSNKFTSLNSIMVHINQSNFLFELSDK